MPENEKPCAFVAERHLQNREQLMQRCVALAADGSDKCAVHSKDRFGVTRASRRWRNWALSGLPRVSNRWWIEL